MALSSACNFTSDHIVVLPARDAGVVADGGSDGAILDASAGDMLMLTCRPPITGSTCDNLPQCGCPSGQNCMVSDLTSGASTCFAAGTTPNYSSCTLLGQGQCMVGSECIGGNCKPFCASLSDCPGAYRECIVITDSNGSAIPGLKACTQLCDPVNPQSTTAPFLGCGANVNCFPSTDGVSDCDGPATPGGTQGASCASGTTGDQTLCASGFVCLNDAASAFHCYKMCAVGSNADCTGTAAGKTCSQLLDASSNMYRAGTKLIGDCQ